MHYAKQREEDAIKHKQKTALGTLWKYYGYNKADMARALDVTPQAVNDWFKRGRISAVKAIIVEEVTDGKLTKEFMRPDVAEWFGV